MSYSMPVPHCFYRGEDVQWILRLTSSQTNMSLFVATLCNVELHEDFFLLFSFWLCDFYSLTMTFVHESLFPPSVQEAI